MNLTTTEKYALAVLEAHGKLSALQREEQALHLVASCIRDMMQAGVVTADGEGKLRISAPLPTAISYCSPIYEWLTTVNTAERSLYMNLTTTEKYALAVLKVRGKLSALQREEQAVYLAASCVWDMMQAGAVTADGEGKLSVSAPLPETISYCGPVYEWLAKKSVKQEQVALKYISALTRKRTKALVESIANDLIDKSVLVVEQQDGAKQCHVDTAVIAEDMEAMRDMEGAVTPDQLMLAELLLDSRTAKKLLNKQELSIMKKAVKRANGGFHVYIREVKKYFDTINTIILVCMVVSASVGGPALLW